MGILSTLFTEWTFTSFLIGLLLCYVAYWYLTIPNNIPPGPRGLPLLGYVPFMGKIPYQTLLQLGRKYGSIYSLYIGNRLVVVLNDFEAVTEAFVKQAEIFSGRPHEFKHLMPVENYKNIVVCDGEFWRDHRRFVLTLMRDCGVGKISIECRMMDEIYHFLNELQKYQGKSVDCSNIINMSVANNISIMALGKRHDYDEPTFLALTQKLHDFNKLYGATAVLMFIPWLKYIPGIRQLINYDRLRTLVTEFDQYLEQIVEDHKVNHKEGQRDHYVSAYITEQKARYNKFNQVDETFTDKALVANMRILEGAGIETTSTTLMWAIVFMMQHPEVQKKVQDELDQVIGFDRSPSWNDRFRTPYTEATICEIQRMGNVAPINAAHRNTEECEVLGYKIPGDTYIIVLLGSIAFDSKLWIDPQNFRPERFLNDKGEVERPPYFIPFSIGKRQCLGENLAKMELYLYFTSMLQTFSFVKPTNEYPTSDSQIGFTNIPQNRVSRVILRDRS